MGKDLKACLEGLGVPDLARAMDGVRSTKATQKVELALPQVSGGKVEVAMSLIPLLDGGTLEAIGAIGHDLTGLRLLQRQVMHAGKLATVGQIAAGVAHEINNPLTSVQVLTEAVLRKANLALSGRVANLFEPSDAERLKRIQEGAERIRKVARDLVSYARPSTREVETFQFNDVLEHALSFCEHVLSAANATLIRELDASLPPIRAVRDHLMQVVINLVSNAAQSMGEGGGTITIRTAREENFLALTIIDTGQGIEAADRDQVFEPFFTTKPAGQGTGLGLPVVRNIVDSHGGTIHFESEVGKGTTFHVLFPLGSTPRTPQIEQSVR